MLHPIIGRKDSYISKEKSNYYCHSEYKLFLDFLYEGEQNGKKEGGMTMEEYVLELYNLLYTTEWQDIVSFLGIVFCMKIVIVYMEEQGMFYSFSSRSMCNASRC